MCSPSIKMPPKSRAKASQTLKSSANAADLAGVANGSLVPNWPLLQPLIPTADPSMQILLQDQIILIRQFFTPSLCRTYVSFLSSLPLITTPAAPKEGNAVRINDRFEVHDAGFAQRLWSSTCLAHVLSGLVAAEERTPPRPDEVAKIWGGELCGLNPRIRVYRYRKGHRFGPHCRFTKMIHHIGWDIFVLMSISGIFSSLLWSINTLFNNAVFSHARATRIFFCWLLCRWSERCCFLDCRLKKFRRIDNVRPSMSLHWSWP